MSATSPTAGEASEKVVVLLIARERCQGHARCSVVAPGLIELDESGFARVVGDGCCASEADQRRAARAAASCPEAAITLEDGTP